MSLLPVTLYGDKILRNKAKRVEKLDVELITLIKNMFDTMYNADGIGLAANQVGSEKSVFILDISPVKEYSKYEPMVFINPQIIESSEETIGYEEGCLSIPEVRAEVIRPKRVKVKFLNSELKETVIEADDLLARVIQHEYDHLQGIFFTDKISEDQRKKLKKDLNKIKNRKTKVDYPVTEKGLY